MNFGRCCHKTSRCKNKFKTKISDENDKQVYVASSFLYAEILVVHQFREFITLISFDLSISSFHIIYTYKTIVSKYKPLFIEIPPRINRDMANL